MTTRRPRGKLREDILDAADRLLFESGDANEVSIEAVVDAVGCTPPALYYYFPSKERLLLDVCHRQYQRFADELEAQIPATTDPIDELVARGHAYLDWAVMHPEHYRILFMTTTWSSPEEAAADPRQSAGMAELIDNLERAMAEGAIAEGDPLAMALMLWSTVHGIAALAVANPTLPRELAHAVVDFTGRAVIQAFSRTGVDGRIPTSETGDLEPRTVDGYKSPIQTNAEAGNDRQ